MPARAAIIRGGAVTAAIRAETVAPEVVAVLEAPVPEVVAVLEAAVLEAAAVPEVVAVPEAAVVAAEIPTPAVAAEAVPAGRATLTVRSAAHPWRRDWTFRTARGASPAAREPIRGGPGPCSRP